MSSTLVSPVAPASGAAAPGTSSAANAYQAAFNSAYYASKPPPFQTLYNGRPGSADPSAAALTQDQAWAVVAQLLAQGWLVDEEIDAESMDPYTTMFMRELYGQTWEPTGMGNVPSSEVLAPGEYSGPVASAQIASQSWAVLVGATGVIAIRVSTFLADYPAYPAPADNAPVAPPTPLAANPVGIRIIAQMPSQSNYVGDVFRCALANDGYPLGGTWTGAAGAFTGTWTKQALEAGLMTVWTKTA